MNIDNLDKYDEEIQAAKANLTQVRVVYYASILLAVIGVFIIGRDAFTDNGYYDGLGFFIGSLLFVLPGCIGIFLTRFCVWSGPPKKHKFPPLKHFARLVTKAQKDKTDYLLSQS